MTGALFRQFVVKQQFQRNMQSACFDICLLQYHASVLEDKYCYFSDLNIYS